MSVSEAQRKISSTEFLEWGAYLEMLPNMFDPMFWYLAQIAKEVRLSFTTKRRKFKTEDFLIEFEAKSRPKDSKPKTQEERERWIDRSKRFWFGLLGMKPPEG